MTTKVGREMLMIRTSKVGTCCCGHAGRQRTETFSERVVAGDLENTPDLARLAALRDLEKRQAEFMAGPVKCLGCPEPWRQERGA